jgi:hypothetical protein
MGEIRELRRVYEVRKSESPEVRKSGRRKKSEGGGQSKYHHVIPIAQRGIFCALPGVRKSGKVGK